MYERLLCFEDLVCISYNDELRVVRRTRCSRVEHLELPLEGTPVTSPPVHQ